MNINKPMEFDKIKEIWADLAITDRAKEKIYQISWYYSERELRKQLRDTTDARQMIENLGEPPLQNITEIKEILLIPEKGESLTPYQLERVEKVLVGFRHRPHRGYGYCYCHFGRTSKKRSYLSGNNPLSGSEGICL